MRTFAVSSRKVENETAKPHAHGRKRELAEPDNAHAASPFSAPTIQRKASCACGGGCPDCQAKSSGLKISQPNDPAEIEADQIADQVMRMADSETQPTANRVKSPSTIHRTCAPCARGGSPCPKCEAEKKPSVQRKTEQSPTRSVRENYLHDLGSGRSLEPETRAFMEPRFGRDFGQVRVHTDTKAVESARTVNALAYTAGHKVVFGAGQYMPHSSAGKRLIAHELAHIVQQRTLRDSLSGTISTSSAEGLDNDAAAANSHQTGHTLVFGSVHTPLIQRQDRETPTPTPAPTPTPTPCPTSVVIGSLTPRNHSDLSASQKETYRTMLGVMSRMNVGPGPDHTGHCMKERMTLISNNCPASVYTRGGETVEPCSGDKCLDINRSRTYWGLSDGPTSFIDMHRTRQRNSLLEGADVDSCEVVCEQTYSCDRRHATTGTFQITRNYQAGNFTRADGTTVHITTGTVTKQNAPVRPSPGTP